MNISDVKVGQFYTRTYNGEYSYDATVALIRIDSIAGGSLSYTVIAYHDQHGRTPGRSYSCKSDRFARGLTAQTSNFARYGSSTAFRLVDPNNIPKMWNDYADQIRLNSSWAHDETSQTAIQPVIQPVIQSAISDESYGMAYRLKNRIRNVGGYEAIEIIARFIQDEL